MEGFGVKLAIANPCWTISSTLHEGRGEEPDVGGVWTVRGSQAQPQIWSVVLSCRPHTCYQETLSCHVAESWSCTSCLALKVYRGLHSALAWASKLSAFELHRPGDGFCSSVVSKQLRSVKKAVVFNPQIWISRWRSWGLSVAISLLGHKNQVLREETTAWDFSLIRRRWLSAFRTIQIHLNCLTKHLLSNCFYRVEW